MGARRMGRYANIVLTGFMGTGKTTIGRLVAEKLGWRFVDTDHLIEARAGKSIAAIFFSQGEPAFRALESEICAEVSTMRRMVIATGGGVWMAPVNREKLSASGLVICLRAPLEQIEARLSSDSARPLLGNPHDEAERRQRMTELLNARAEVYATIPHAIDTGGLTPYA